MKIDQSFSVDRVAVSHAAVPGLIPGGVDGCQSPIVSNLGSYRFSSGNSETQQRLENATYWPHVSPKLSGCSSTVCGQGGETSSRLVGPGLQWALDQ